MRKYLELFTNGFDSTIAEKTKVENWPYVGYSPSEGVKFTVIPEPVVGPADNEIWYTSTDGNVVTPHTTDVFGANIVSNTYENGKGVITFDGDVTSIGTRAFQSCSSLTSVTIGNSVTNIGHEAFNGCSSLTSVTIGNSVTNIRSGAFCYCSSLTSITIPEGVTSVGENAFLACSSLKSIIIPNSVMVIVDYAFAACSSLSSITFEGTVEQWRDITKGDGWKNKVPATYVQCTDGQVAI